MPPRFTVSVFKRTPSSRTCASKPGEHDQVGPRNLLSVFLRVADAAAVRNGFVADILAGMTAFTRSRVGSGLAISFSLVFCNSRSCPASRRQFRVLGILTTSYSGSLQVLC